MEPEKTLVEESADPALQEPSKESIADTVKRTVDKLKGKAVDVIENTANHLSPVKTRTMARMKQLTEASKWTHEKQVIMGHVEWKDTPPELLIGQIDMNIQGGIGRISYVQYLEDPDTHQALKQASEDGMEIGGNIISHYVEETIEPAQKIVRESVEVGGCPTAEIAKERMMKARQSERDRVKRTRGAG